MTAEIAALSLADLETLATRLEAAGQADRLVPVLARLSELAPKQPAYARRLGWAYLALSRGAEAEAAFKKAAALKDPERVAVDAGLGRARALQGDDAGAIDPLKRAVMAGDR